MPSSHGGFNFQMPFFSPKRVKRLFLTPKNCKIVTNEAPTKPIDLEQFTSEIDAMY